MATTFLIIAAVLSLLGGVMFLFAASRPALSVTERWAVRAGFLLTLAGIFNTVPGLLFPTKEWVRWLSGALGLACTCIGLGALWHMIRRAKALKSGDEQLPT